MGYFALLPLLAVGTTAAGTMTNMIYAEHLSIRIARQLRRGAETLKRLLCCQLGFHDYEPVVGVRAKMWELDGKWLRCPRCLSSIRDLR